jgi:phosphopantetheinyl transferase
LLYALFYPDKSDMPDNRVYFTVKDVPDRTRQSSGGREMLAQLAAALDGRPVRDFCIATEPSGRPILTTTDGTKSEVYVSLSHSGPKVACAATMLGPIGIDIERSRPDRNIAGIAEAAFGQAERERCAREGIAGFYRIWTVREAIAKALGAGLGMVGDRQDRAATGPDEGSWPWQGWRLAHHRLPASLNLAIAVLPNDPALAEIDWHEVTLPGA